ncbi:hypothetical protein QAD02_017539 [Eretmocerus hayati]|uniref:Uncharacterized protein n=1 Tax=Eretmocerus hayati TaxID=131215 RepID=A0ACC2PH52_9HYME|nr:hypothetical protein QAD02_017539 [Eretmocerus hayati]
MFNYYLMTGGHRVTIDIFSDELLSGVLDGPAPTNNQKTGQQLQSGQSDSNPPQPADNSNKPSAPPAPSAPGYPPGSAYPPGGAAYPQNGYPGYPQYPGPPPPGGYPNANGAPNPYPYGPPNGYQNVYPQLPPNGFPNPGTYNPNYPPPPNGVPPYQGGYNPYGGSPPPTTTKKPSLAEQLTKGLTSLAKQYLKEAAIGALKDKLN